MHEEEFGATAGCAVATAAVASGDGSSCGLQKREDVRSFVLPT